MRATDFEFRNRFWLIGLIFWAGFACYFFDPTNAAVRLLKLFNGAAVDEDTARGRHQLQVIFAAAAMLPIIAAGIRTWAAAYLRSEVIHDSKLRTEKVTADGPYRHVRNPLYLGTLLLALGLAVMASRTGWFVMVPAMILFQYRLILREEDDLKRAQGERYRVYLAAVPRLWPSLRARLPASGLEAKWNQAWLGEAYFWGFAVAEVCFAATLNALYFYVIAGASLLFYVVILPLWQRWSRAPGPPARAR